MTNEWLQCTILRAASLLVPNNERAEWLEWWRSELWYVPPRRATSFCLGAFCDALWLRRNNLRPVKRSRIHLESPLRCLAFLATLALVSSLSAVCLSGIFERSTDWHLRARQLPFACIAMLMISCLVLPATLAVGRVPGRRHPIPWPGKIRNAIFLALKVALVQPMMLCASLVGILIAPAVPLAQLAIIVPFVLALRWVFTDQQRRCPVCLRLLTYPVRIGNPSRTVLGWYGAASLCSRGHGFLQVPELSPSYSGEQQWLNLDGSWSGLFAESVVVRQR
jgi:hypothetical protein